MSFIGLTPGFNELRKFLTDDFIQKKNCSFVFHYFSFMREDTLKREREKKNLPQINFLFYDPIIRPLLLRFEKEAFYSF